MIFFPQSLGLKLKTINQRSLSSVSKKQRQAIWWSAINFYVDGWDLLFGGIVKIDLFHKCINNSAGKNRCLVIVYNLLDILEGNSWTDRRHQSFKIKKKKKVTETYPQNMHVMSSSLWMKDNAAANQTGTVHLKLEFHSFMTHPDLSRGCGGTGEPTLPDTWMTQQELYVHVRFVFCCFFVRLGHRGYWRRPLGGIVSLRQIPELSRGWWNVTTTCKWWVMDGWTVHFWGHQIAHYDFTEK